MTFPLIEITGDHANDPASGLSYCFFKKKCKRRDLGCIGGDICDGLKEGIGENEKQCDGRQILFDIKLQIWPSEVVVVEGASGSGKSTLLSLIGGLRKPQNGKIIIRPSENETDSIELTKDSQEEDLMKARRLIGFIFQRYNLFSSLTALQNVDMGRESWRRPIDRINLLTYLGLEKKVGTSGTDVSGNGMLAKTLAFWNVLWKRDHWYAPMVGAFSGGESQRVAVARALKNNPALILADEPTAALDASSGLAVITLLRHLANPLGKDELDNLVGQTDIEGKLTASQREWLTCLNLGNPVGTTSLVVTHDARIRNRADRIVRLDLGRIVSDIVVKERLYLLWLLDHCPAFSVLSSEKKEAIADKLAIGKSPLEKLDNSDSTLDNATEKAKQWRNLRKGAKPLEEKEVAKVRRELVKAVIVPKKVRRYDPGSRIINKGAPLPSLNDFKELVRQVDELEGLVKKACKTAADEDTRLKEVDACLDKITQSAAFPFEAFFLRSGEVNIFETGNETEEPDNHLEAKPDLVLREKPGLKTYHRAYFGDRALVEEKNRVRNATVVAKGEVTVYIVPGYIVCKYIDQSRPFIERFQAAYPRSYDANSVGTSVEK